LDELIFPTLPISGRKAVEFRSFGNAPVAYMEYERDDWRTEVRLFLTANGSPSSLLSLGLPKGYLPSQNTPGLGISCFCRFVEEWCQGQTEILLTSSYSAVGFYKKLAAELLDRGLIASAENGYPPNAGGPMRYLAGKRRFAFRR
jgi:hypothetical protein